MCCSAFPTFTSPLFCRRFAQTLAVSSDASRVSKFFFTCMATDRLYHTRSEDTTLEADCEVATSTCFNMAAGEIVFSSCI